MVMTQIGPILEVNHTYPFGLTIDGISGTGSGRRENKFRYNGKEQQTKEFSDDSGLEWFDYGARFYDAQIGRWHAVDPLSDSSRRGSVYSSNYNNPILFTDPDGRFADYYDRGGTYLGTDGVDDDRILLMKEGKAANWENKSVNWGGILSKAHAEALEGVSTEVGGLIIQSRVEEGADYTVSEFKTVGGKQSVRGYMLEPEGPSTKQSGQDKRIPEGVYNVEDYSSKKYPDNFRLFNEDVSKSRAILYHSGNTGANTEGCNMPGSTKGNGTVGGSKAKMKELREFIKSVGDSNIKVIINNRISKK
jgi:RHS repeat-associated protein